MLGGLLGKLHDGRRADGEVETTDIVRVGILNQAPDLGLLQVVEVIVVSSTEISAERAGLASDNDTAATGLLLGVDTVLDAQTSLLHSIVENGGVLVVTGTTEVNDAVGGQDVLSTTSGVLGGATGDELGVVVVEEVLVERDVLLLSEDGVVGSEAVLVEKGLVAEGLDVLRLLA